MWWVVFPWDPSEKDLGVLWFVCKKGIFLKHTHLSVLREDFLRASFWF